MGLILKYNLGAITYSMSLPSVPELFTPTNSKTYDVSVQEDSDSK